MNQDIIVFTVLALVISYTVYSFVRNLRVSKSKSGCSGCSGCELTKIKTACNETKFRI